MKYIIIIIIIILSSGCADLDTNKTIEYNQGYLTGYNEHNKTDYNVCNEYYYHGWGFNKSLNRKAFDFAHGYMKGYEQWEYDNTTMEYEKKIEGIMNE